ncbi:MAG: type II secretion system F family protein [Halobacteriaceae archaeon]
MAIVHLLPLGIAIALAISMGIAVVSRSVSKMFQRIGLAVFGSYVQPKGDGDHQQPGIDSQRLTALRSAHYSVTYRAYAATTLLYATISILVGSIIGIYIVTAIFFLLGLPSTAIANVLPTELQFVADLVVFPQLTLPEIFIVFIGSTLTVGLLTGYTVYRFRWWWPSYLADIRARKIDASLHRSIAFIYALSRSGMSFPEILRILSRNEHVYGEAAKEVRVSVKDMDLFGSDIHNSLQRLSERTPSQNMAEFVENLTSVLQSGRKLEEFLREQYQHYKEEQETQQEQFLSVLATLAEVYVTVLVAGPLFLITILVIIGLVFGGTLTFIQVLTYFLIPLATVGFMIYLRRWSVSSQLDTGEEQIDNKLINTLSDIRIVSESETVSTDGGQVIRYSPDQLQKNKDRLRIYNQLRWLFRRIQDPIGVIYRHPYNIFYITLPIAIGYTIYQLWPSILNGTFQIRTVDDVFVQMFLFLAGSYAVVYEYRKRHLLRFEDAIPDFLDRFASVNEAGMPIVASLGRVLDSDLGALDRELSRTWADIQWGAEVENALLRFKNRVQSPTVSRAITLITNAMNASGNIAPVLRIASDEALQARRLRRERQQQLLTYILVIYISFFVFIGITVIMSVVFLPSIPSTQQFASRIAGIGGISEAQKQQYKLIFFHTALVQAIGSGFVAGHMSEGDVRGGTKHATIMLGIAYIVFLIFA